MDQFLPNASCAAEVSRTSDVFDYAPGPGPGSVPPPPELAGSPRYVYLLTRLRGRQITMEEATELFALQQAMIRAGSSRPRSPPSPPPTASGPAAGGPIAPMLDMSDDGLAFGLLVLGAGAGIIAALIKRAKEGPTPGPTTP